MHRMVYPFLAVFGRGLGVDLPAMGLAVTIRSLGGVLGPFLAVVADSRGRKAGMLLGLVVFTVGTAMVVLWPTYPVFILTLLLTMLGKYVFDPSMQAYLGDRVPYERRGRAMAITEYGWSLSFFIGVPVMGFLISRWGWLAPFPLLSLLGAVSLIAVAWMLPRDPDPDPAQAKFWSNLRTVLTYPPALLGLSIGLFSSTANEIINLVFGVWLERLFWSKNRSLGRCGGGDWAIRAGGRDVLGGFHRPTGQAQLGGGGLAVELPGSSGAAPAGQVVTRGAGGFVLVLYQLRVHHRQRDPDDDRDHACGAGYFTGNWHRRTLPGRALGALLATPLYSLGLASGELPGLFLSSLAAIFFNLIALVAVLLLRKKIG